MIIFTDKILHGVTAAYFILNSYLYKEYIPKPCMDISYLMPSDRLLDLVTNQDGIDSPEFDNQYANEIMNDTMKFTCFMSIIQYVYTNPGEIAVVLINDSPYRNSIKESLIKFIQCRYGYSCYTVSDEDDLEFTLSQSPRFTLDGAFNLTEDQIRLTETTVNLSDIESEEAKENLYAQRKGRLPLPSETI